ncbi:MAG: hypothetical protein HZB51_31550 [Chloroflexi bacterium]|nr:hypothetical protein [Chloroflexota bacterium]
MDYRIDPKGKVFTSHVTKRSITVILSIENTIVQGNVYLMADNRLKDELNDGEQFIAVTDAQIYQPGSESPMYESSAIIVNKEKIAWIFPKEATAPPEDALT